MCTYTNCILSACYLEMMLTGCNSNPSPHHNFAAPYQLHHPMTSQPKDVTGIPPTPQLNAFLPLLLYSSNKHQHRERALAQLNAFLPLLLCSSSKQQHKESSSTYVLMLVSIGPSFSANETSEGLTQYAIPIVVVNAKHLWMVTSHVWCSYYGAVSMVQLL